jgi:hypothetical protein
MLSIALFLPVANAHPDKVEDRLLLHFATGVHPIENGAWPDLTHKLTAKVQGEPKLANIGPAQALNFNGFTDWLLVASDRATAQPALPKQQFSVAAWVVVNETHADGGLAIKADKQQDADALFENRSAAYEQQKLAYTAALSECQSRK